MAKATKNQQIWFSALKLILFLGVIFVFRQQIIKAGIDFKEVEVPSVGALILAIFLVPLNWWLEYMKWKLTLDAADVSTPISVKRHSFFAGIVTGMLTPNMLGNFLGRMYYFQRRDRVSITILTLFTNYAQFVASMVFGFIAFILLHKTPMGILTTNWILLIGFSLIIIVLSFFYFDRFFKILFPSRMRLYFRFRGMKERNRFRFGVLLLSLIRHVVFTIQFGAMMTAFGADICWVEIHWIWQYYFWVTLTPSLFLGKFLIRDSVALWVLGAIIIQQEVILISSLMIWCLNLLLPTFVALILAQHKNKIT
jgi:hypothetical protein